MDEPLNILINGWYGQLNAGDDAILDVFLEQTRARFNANITVLSETPENIPPTLGVRCLRHPIMFGRGAVSALLAGTTWRHLKEIRKADLFILGGGGILRDNTTWRNLLRLLDEVWFAKLFGKKVMLYAIGVGPFKTRLGRKLIGASARMCDLVTVRSERGAQLLREVGVEPERIHVVSDPAFLLKPRMPADPELLRLLAADRKTICFYPTVALDTVIPGDSHIIELAKALDQIGADPDVQLVAMPMSVCESVRDDIATAHRIRSSMRHPERLHIYEKRLDAAELKWVTGQATLNLTVRLHAMIFSLGSGVPVVAVNYEPKVANVFADFWAPQYLIEMGPDMGDKLVQAASLALRNLPGYAADLRQRQAPISARAVRTFDLMRALYPDLPSVRSRTEMKPEAKRAPAKAGHDDISETDYTSTSSGAG